MANKRVSELNELLSSQVDDSDLFLITDIIAVESKKIRASELRIYNSQTTASWAQNAVSASLALLASSASWSPPTPSASYALSASHADSANSSSYVVSASFALSSSWANQSFSSVSASYALTASVNLVVSSALADTAKTASFLLYTNGFNNGTSSAAISSSFAIASNQTKLLIYDGVNFNGTSSAAVNAAFADSASNALTASMMFYDGVTSNGTASVAVSASLSQWSNFVNQPMLAGIFDATITSTSESRMATMSLNRSTFASSMTYLTFTGTVIFNHSGSNTQSLAMVAVNQDTNLIYFYDAIPLQFAAGGASSVTGSMKQSVTMQGARSLDNGDYLVYVTASTPNDLYFDTAGRTMRFRIDSESDNVSISA